MPGRPPRGEYEPVGLEDAVHAASLVTGMPPPDSVTRLWSGTRAAFLDLVVKHMDLGGVPVGATAVVTMAIALSFSQRQGMEQLIHLVLLDGGGAEVHARPWQRCLLLMPTTCLIKCLNLNRG